MDAETRRRLEALRAAFDDWLTNEECGLDQSISLAERVLRDVDAVLAALPAEPSPDLVALVREWQKQERRWRSYSSVNRRADEVALLAAKLPGDSDGR